MTENKGNKLKNLRASLMYLFFRLSAMNLDAVKKRYWKKDVKTTKPEFSQSILQETLVAQHAANWAIILAAYQVRPLP